MKVSSFHHLDKHSIVFLCFFCFRPTVPLKLLPLFRKSSKLCSRLSAVHVFKKTCTALKREHHFHCLTPLEALFDFAKLWNSRHFSTFGTCSGSRNRAAIRKSALGLKLHSQNYTWVIQWAPPSPKRSALESSWLQKIEFLQIKQITFPKTECFASIKH